MYLDFVPILPSPEFAPQDVLSALKPGQVLPAKLISTSDGKAALQLAGRTYTASGALPSGPGPFWVQVQTVEPSKIQVKLLPTGYKQGPDIQALFQTLGLKANRETKHVVQQLLRWRLPLSRELVHKFISCAKDIPAEDRPAFWSTLAFLESLQIKDSPQKIKAALKYLLRRPDAAPEGQETINRTWPLYPDQEAIRILTLQAGQNQGEVFVIFRYQGQEEQPLAEDQLQSLVIRLSTAAWGQVWIQLWIQGRNLAAKVWAEDSSFLSRAQAACPELKKRFGALGWELAALTTAQKKVTSIAELVEPPGPDNYRPLDAFV